MNKKLVAVAVAGLLAAPLAAQAQTANVTLYGRLNMLERQRTGGCYQPPVGPNRSIHLREFELVAHRRAGGNRAGGGQSRSSRSDGINADISGGVHGSRETFVDLQGTWGTFKMGRFRPRTTASIPFR
jgi:hypothetical protein